MIQIRNVPEPLHRELKARAAHAGQSLSDFLLQELTRVVAKPTLAELWKRIQARGSVGPLSPSPAEVMREERDRRA